MALVSFPAVSLSEVNERASAVCGDSSNNIYRVGFRSTVVSGSSIGVIVSLTGASPYATTVVDSRLFDIPMVTSSTTPTCTITVAAKSGTASIRPLSVEYAQTATAPPAPTILVENTPTNGWYKLNVKVTDPSHPFAIKNRTIQTVNKETGATSQIVTTLNTVLSDSLESYTTYKIRAKVTDVNGLSSDWSAYSEKTTYSQPDQPVASVSTITSSSVVLNGSAFTNKDSSGHGRSTWVVKKISTGEIVYNDTSDTYLEAITVSSGITANTDYSATVQYVSDRYCKSYPSTPISFSTAEADAKKGKGKAFIQATKYLQAKASAYITTDPDISRGVGTAFISARKTVSGYASVWIESDPWDEESSQDTTWEEET